MSCKILIFLTLLVRPILCSSSCIQFEFAENIPLESVQVISNFSAASRTELFGICAPRCMKDMRCNAFDICNDECRTIRGWLPIYIDSGSGDLCERHQIECDAGYYYDRQKERCVRHYYCDFELVIEESCFLSESKTDNIDWTRRSGATVYSNTGPSSANFGSYYKYIQSVNFLSSYSGTLESIEHFEDNIYCLSLYYHMYGSNIKSLIISTQNGTDAPVDHWTMTGNQGNNWYRLMGLNLQLDPQTKVLITGEQGYYYGDIAIDFIELWPFACPDSV